MDNLDFPEILKIGFVGIGFLLAGLAFLLLRAEQGKNKPRPGMITPIYVFMGFSLILAGAALYLQARNTDGSNAEAVAAAIAPYKSKLDKLNGLVDGKLIYYLENESGNPTAKAYAEALQKEMQSAKDDGLIK